MMEQEKKDPYTVCITFLKRVNKNISSTMLNVLSLLENWKWKIKEWSNSSSN